MGFSLVGQCEPILSPAKGRSYPFAEDITFSPSLLHHIIAVARMAAVFSVCKFFSDISGFHKVSDGAFYRAAGY